MKLSHFSNWFGNSFWKQAQDFLWLWAPCNGWFKKTEVTHGRFTNRHRPNERCAVSSPGCMSEQQAKLSLQLTWACQFKRSRCYNNNENQSLSATKDGGVGGLGGDKKKKNHTHKLMFHLLTINFTTTPLASTHHHVCWGELRRKLQRIRHTDPNHKLEREERAKTKEEMFEQNSSFLSKTNQDLTGLHNSPRERQNQKE